MTVRVHIDVYCDTCDRMTEATAELKLKRVYVKVNPTQAGIAMMQRHDLDAIEFVNVKFPRNTHGAETGWVYGKDGARCPGCSTPRPAPDSSRPA